MQEEQPAGVTGNVRRVTHDCVLAPLEYWGLREDHGYLTYVAEHSTPPNTHVVLSESEDESGWITRTSKLTPKKNPVPVALRGMLGCRESFTFTIEERWHRHHCDAAHPLTFVTEPPVLSDRILVSGKQWVEPHGSGCRLCFELDVTCKVRGAGARLSKGIVDGSFTAYEQLPARALEYVTLRRAASEAAGAGEAGRTTDTGADGTELPANADEAAADAGIDELAALRLRARMRWRLALLGWRFTRAVERQQTEEHRLCDAKVDEPQTEGFGPRRHTTYRVCSRVRPAISVGWMICRHRYSDFARLRLQLLSFLPGVDLPELPEKQRAKRLHPEVIETRRVLLEAFVQAVLDHPILSTADELAAFLEWPADEPTVRAPLFTRAQTCLDTPISAQREARERLWALRRQATTSSRLSDAPPPSSVRVESDESGRSPSSRRSVPLASVSTAVGSATVSAAGSPAPPPPHTPTDPSYTAQTLGDDGLAGELSVRKSATFSDALAAAMLRTMEDAATVVQSRARANSSCRTSRLTDHSDDGDTEHHRARHSTPRAPSHGFGTSRRFAEAAEAAARLSARVEAAASHGNVPTPPLPRQKQHDQTQPATATPSSSPRDVSSSASGAGESDVAILVLHKLEEIEDRLHAIEAQHRRQQLWDSFMCGCGAP